MPTRTHTLTGKELRFAAEREIPVLYEEKYYDPSDRHMNFNGECVMTPANVGYYIGNSDINPQDFDDDEPVAGDFPEGTFRVSAVKNQNYKENN
jgi:hypothetical protein